MAEAIIAEVVSVIAEKLGSKVCKEIMSARNQNSQIKRLQELKTTVEAALVDADTHTLELCNNSKRDVLEKFSCALAELDDYMDEKAARAKQKEVMHGNKFIKMVHFFSVSKQLFSPMKDAQKLKTILEKFECIAKCHAQVGAIISRPSVSQLTQKMSSETDWSHVIMDFVVGRDGDRDIIIDTLSESISSETLSVVSIVGIGGIGKTTLAQYVYHDERVKSCFDVRFWVSSTQDFNVRNVLENILGASSSCVNDVDQLYEHFLGVIGGKKFLLVLDNVWDQDGLRLKWLHLRRLLAFGAKGSKVLITTRFQTVAGVLDSVSPYTLDDLTEHDSWVLFQNVAFTRWQEEGVQEIGLEIARMCPNVPLVIRSIGGILAGKQTLQEWQAFRNDQLASFASYGRNITQTRILMYDQLDTRLKLCVAYCSLFPKGFVYDKYELIRLWISLGYIEPQYINQSLEEAGEAYMLSLINYNFFEIDRFDRESARISFNVQLTMHDLMHDLVLSIAGFKYKMADSDKVEFDERVRHVSFGGKMSEMCWEGIFSGCLMLTSEVYWEVPSSLYDVKHLQSLLLTVPSHCKLTLKNISISERYILRFSFLRVLDLHDLGIQNVPQSVGKLRCLRYLNLSWNPMVKLPNSITQLVNLLSLDLFGCHKLQKLPKDMSRLVNLRYLYVKRCDALSHMPKGLVNLTDLRTLDVFKLVREHNSSNNRSKAKAVGGLAELNCLNNLAGGLKICISTKKLSDVASETTAANLKSKDKLMRLHLEFTDGNKKDEEMAIEGLKPNANLRELVIQGYTGEMLPSWMLNHLHDWLPNLVYITLYNCQGCRTLCSLGKLPRLKVLYLLKLDNVEYIENVSTHGDSSANSSNVMNEHHDPLFPSLEVLSLEGMPKLKRWWKIHSGEYDLRLPLQEKILEWKMAFPRLRLIYVDNMELLNSLAREFGRPFYPESDITIQRSRYCSMDLLRRFQDAAGEDWHKIEHDSNVCVSSNCMESNHNFSEGNESKKVYEWKGNSKGSPVVSFH